LKKHIAPIAILLTVAIGLFPDIFKNIGDFLMENKIEVMLIFIIVTLFYICHQFSAIKEYLKTPEDKPPKK